MLHQCIADIIWRHPIKRPWHPQPMVNIIPHIIRQTAPRSVNLVDAVPKEPAGKCNDSAGIVQYLNPKTGNVQCTIIIITDTD